MSREMNLARKNPFVPALSAMVLLLLALSPFITRSYTIILLSNIFMYVILTVSWTIFSGSTGYISLASAAFFGAGIYASAFAQALPLPLVVLCGGLTSLCLALLIGCITLRLRGVYFTIFTFGLIELLKHVILWWEINMAGTRGRFILTADSVTGYYAMLLIMVALLATALIIGRSRFGLALRSIGECEDAAAHAGINVTLVKVTAFAVSAFFIGAAGAVMATRWNYIDPMIAFNSFYSFLPVLMAIFGDMKNLLGPIMGAAVFTYLQECLITRFPYYYMLIFGVIMVCTVLYLPGGLLGLPEKWRTRPSGEKHGNAASRRTM
ncbi:MAG: branched-chain amino acid ABC transporter permease [Ignavibacteriales bacterium]